MNRAYAAKVLKELARRSELAPGLLDAAFPVQRAFCADNSRLKAALCTRRAGKSYGIGLWLVEGTQKWPGTSQIYLALTRDSARRIMIKDVLKVINREHKLGAVFTERPLEMRFPNGSVIYLLGADADDEEREKILGQKYKRAAIDECASFRTDLKELVEKIVRPTLIDLEGELCLTGTPGNVKNFFCDVTEGRVPGWSVHRWTTFDNPHMAEKFRREIAQLETENPLIRETPIFKQMYQGKWETDASLLAYKYNAARNAMNEAPELAGEIRYVLGLDLGYADDSAIVVGAYSDHDPTLYIVYAKKRDELIISQVAAWVNKLRETFPISTFIVDGAAKQSVEELRQRHGLPLEAAEKTGKSDAIKMMNSDLITGRVKLLMPSCKSLAGEWGTLVWDEDELPKLVEDPRCANHLADAALYAWRYATNYAAMPEKKRPARGTEEEIREQEEREDEQAIREEKLEWWERA